MSEELTWQRHRRLLEEEDLEAEEDAPLFPEDEMEF